MIAIYIFSAREIHQDSVGISLESLLIFNVYFTYIYYFYYLAATDYTYIFKYKKHNSAADVQIIYNEDLIVNLSMI